jgi:hypothetical protein
MGGRWWRRVQHACGRLLGHALASPQDFAFHVLRNCFVVLMTARDEGASFQIFASLNGRGMVRAACMHGGMPRDPPSSPSAKQLFGLTFCAQDLSAVDKLKADLLQVRGAARALMDPLTQLLQLQLLLVTQPQRLAAGGR